MKVGLSTLMIQRGRSGVARYVLGLTRALLSSDTPPDLTLFVLEEDRGLFDFAAGRAQIVTVPERHRPPIRNILWHQLVLPRLTRALDLDLIHIPSYRRMLWPRPCPLVATIHDLAPFRLPGKYDRRRMFYGRHVARWLARRQDRIIAVSDATRSDISRFFGIPTEQLAVVHNGLEQSQFVPGPTDAATELVAKRFGIRGPYFLYVARLEHPAKNHVRLIAAFEQFKAEMKSDWQLVFGGSDWHGAAAIHGAIASSACREDIRCLGFVGEDALPALYRAAKVFVFPSLYEGFGFPPLEAMACGCPVLSSTRGALAEIVPGAAATVDPEDVAAMKAGLANLAANEQLRTDLSAAGLARAQQFDWETTARRTLEVYQSAHASWRSGEINGASVGFNHA